jgi:photosystem II stability/assembly factor-like uncharacterized protein
MDNWQRYEGNFNYIASSANGNKLIASNIGSIYTSVNSGVSWKEHNIVPASLKYRWKSVASSSDGNKLYAILEIIENNTDKTCGIYASYNSGEKWEKLTIKNIIDSSIIFNFSSIAVSADGTKLFVTESYGNIWTSVDSGNNWKSSAELNVWYSIASSFDGNNLIAINDNGYRYIYNDNRKTWKKKFLNLKIKIGDDDIDQKLTSVTSSADGSKLIAIAKCQYKNNRQIYISNDYGDNWKSCHYNSIWNSVALSADGNTLIAINDKEFHISEDLPSFLMPPTASRLKNELLFILIIHFPRDILCIF